MKLTFVGGHLPRRYHEEITALASALLLGEFLGYAVEEPRRRRWRLTYLEKQERRAQEKARLIEARAREETSANVM